MEIFRWFVRANCSSAASWRRADSASAGIGQISATFVSSSRLASLILPAGVRVRIIPVIPGGFGQMKNRMRQQNQQQNQYQPEPEKNSVPMFPFHGDISRRHFTAINHWLFVTRRKIKGDFALFVHHQKRRKRLAGLGNEFVEQIALAASARIFCACAGSIGCCKIFLPILNLHGLASACDFSQI